VTGSALPSHLLTKARGNVTAVGTLQLALTTGSAVSWRRPRRSSGWHGGQHRHQGGLAGPLDPSTPKISSLTARCSPNTVHRPVARDSGHRRRRGRESAVRRSVG